VPGKVNRARRVTETASGKGVNVARVVRQLGLPVRLLTVAGGARGKLLAKELTGAVVVPVAAETRICQTLLSNGPTTELVEEAGPLTKREVAAVFARFRREVRRARVVVLSGTVPAGCGDGFYARLTRIARQHGLPVLVDAQRAQLLNAVAERPLVVKINRDELRACGRRRLDVEWQVITDGPGKVTVRGPGVSAVIVPPRLQATNPIGSGDAVLAGIACGIARTGRMDLAAVRLGVAAGSANALTAMPGHVRLADVRRFERELARP
jgi:tagatose 6-phosphate kinase